jgi:GNAT superfamily N-acetyltransferase
VATTHHLAQVNVATLRAPLDDPTITHFTANLGAINALAESTPGFLWRLQTDDGDATAIKVFDDPRTIINLTVWTGIDELRAYTYRTEHGQFVKRRGEWFVPGSTRLAMWWVPAGSLPATDDVAPRLDFLDQHGPSPYAFTFAHRHGPLDIEPATIDDPGVALLFDALNAELFAADPQANHFWILDAADVDGTNGVLLLARYGGATIGCGAIRLIADGVGEIKRMYVAPSCRGLKIGQAVLGELERHARRMGIGELRLETGDAQRQAISVYERAGYVRVPCWGDYADSHSSRCFGKTL